MSSRSHPRFVPSLESLGDRLTPGVLAAESPSDATPHEWVFGVELPSAGSEVRYRTFAIVDRTPSTDGVVLLTSSLPGGTASASKDMVLKGSKILQNAPVDIGGNEVITIGGNRTELTGESTTAQRRNLITLLSADVDSPGAGPGPYSFATDGRASGL